MRDLETPGDLRRLVERFYGAIRSDDVLGPIFASRLRDDDWPEHLDTMTRFWSSILMGLPLYHGNPIASHRGLPLSPQHFARWLELWGITVAELFAGPAANDIIARAHRIAGVLSRHLVEEVTS